MYILKPETADLAPAVELMLDTVFGPGRQDKASYQYRAGVQPVAELSWTAFAGDKLVGTIRYWPILVGESGLQALLLGTECSGQFPLTPPQPIPLARK